MTMGGSSGDHFSAFGQVVTGPPGAGKSTYCNGMHQLLAALGRPVHIVNLDPASPEPTYPCAINITDLISLDEVMDEHGLGPNGAILYCIEYLEKNWDWLVEKLDELLAQEEDQSRGGYIIFDTPGQVELWTNHDSLKNVINRLTKLDYRLAVVHLSDAHHIVDASKFVSVVLLALRAMMQLELPHINVLSKLDLLSDLGGLPFDLRYYTEAQDLQYLLSNLRDRPGGEKMRKLDEAMVELIDQYSLVGFETLAVDDRQSMLKLLKAVDKATGHVFLPKSQKEIDADELLQAMNREVPGMDIDDVQERWIDGRQRWDAVEREIWGVEKQVRGGVPQAGSNAAPHEQDGGSID